MTKIILSLVSVGVLSASLQADAQLFQRIGGQLSMNGETSISYLGDTIKGDYKNKGIEIMLGSDIKTDETQGLRIYGNLEGGKSTDVYVYELGAGVEGYIGDKNTHFIYGTTAGLGVFIYDTNTVNLDNDTFLGIEPYIGVETTLENKLGFYAKTGYEYKLVKDVQGVSGMDLSVNGITMSAGIQYTY